MRDAALALPFRQGDTRRAYVAQHPAIVTIAAMATISGIAWLLCPAIIAGSSIGTAPGATEWIWSLVLAVGGILVLAGFYRLDARLEVAGLVLVAGCHLAYGAAIILERGLTTGGVAASLFVTVSAACAARAFVLRFEPEVEPWRQRFKP